jgi:UDP-3-O-[3-hydroxymyristoyl] glucosamine N-acyltransferase
VDRGALDDTVIEDGVKIDNLVQIAHNVHIGAHTVIAGNTGIAGSARIGKRCQIGGAANILGHLTIADGTVISPTSMVTRSLPKAGFYTGIFPLQENEQWEKNAATFRQLYTLRERVKKLEQALAEGRQSNNGN